MKYLLISFFFFYANTLFSQTAEWRKEKRAQEKVLERTFGRSYKYIGSTIECNTTAARCEKYISALKNEINYLTYRDKAGKRAAQRLNQVIDNLNREIQTQFQKGNGSGIKIAKYDYNFNRSNRLKQMKSRLVDLENRLDRIKTTENREQKEKEKQSTSKVVISSSKKTDDDFWNGNTNSNNKTTEEDFWNGKTATKKKVNKEKESDDFWNGKVQDKKEDQTDNTEKTDKDIKTTKEKKGEIPVLTNDELEVFHTGDPKKKTWGLRTKKSRRIIDKPIYSRLKYDYYVDDDEIYSSLPNNLIVRSIYDEDIFTTCDTEKVNRFVLYNKKGERLISKPFARIEILTNDKIEIRRVLDSSKFELKIDKGKRVMYGYITRYYKVEYIWYDRYDFSATYRTFRDDPNDHNREKFGYTNSLARYYWEEPIFDCKRRICKEGLSQRCY